MAGADLTLDADGIASLRLIRTRAVGPITYFQLLRRFGSAQAALEALPDLARRGGGPPPSVPRMGEIEREMAAVAAKGGHYLLFGRDHYPALLAETETAPPALIVIGNDTLPARPTVAMVGARNASAAAIRFARQLAHDLAERGIVIVSGLARGIDTAAHMGSLAGGTIGVIASGLDIFYPPENEALQREIGTRGLIVSEQPPGTEPHARHFPSRNRVIAGLAQGTVVVEAAPKSGSLITARLAADYGRDVMAVPGSPLDPRAQGCNQLIRDGATLVQSAADIAEALQPFGRNHVAAPASVYATAPQPDDANEADRRAITALLSPSPVAVDELIRQSGIAPASVQMVLLELELAGRLERHAGGRVSLA
ncbi:DNA-processing protein DprA [Sphingomonas crusticola]|uniref:DNA-processing protein DprA n=1 Tax=Sphingomonas crusticola TaxID=1697973 RepID=UPI001F07C1B3|nr:DNA-processing protein DprA [Sphingomonas crusticola]